MRLLLRAVAILALFGATILLLLFICPWSMPVINTGLGLNFERATFRISRGLVEVRNPSLVDPVSGEELVRMRGIKMELSFWEFLFSDSPRVIEKIQVNGEFAASLEWAGGQGGISAPWDRIIEIYRNHLGRVELFPTEVVEGIDLRPGVVIRHLSFDVLNFRWAGAQGESLPSWVTLKDVALECEFDDVGRPLNFLLEGKYNEHPATNSLRIVIARDPGDSRLDFRVNVDEFDSRIDFPFDTAFEMMGRDIEFSGSCDIPGKRPWMIDGNFRLGDVKIRDPGSGEVQPHGRMTLSWSAELPVQQSGLELSHLELESELCHMLSSGTLQLFSPHEYDLAVQSFEVTDSGIRLIANQMIPDAGGSITVSREGMIHFSGDVAGDLVKTIPDKIDGRMWFNNATWHTPILSAPLVALDGEVRLTSATMFVRHLKARLLDIPMELGGRIVFRPLGRGVESIDLDWNAGGQLDNIRRLIRCVSAGGEESFELDGTFDARGRFKLNDPFVGSLSDALERTASQGWINILDGRARSLGSDLVMGDVRGRIDLTDGQIHTKDPITGRFRGIDIELELSSKECEPFWNQPFLDIGLKASVNLEQMGVGPGQVSSVSDIKGKLGEIKGRVILDTQLALPLRSPRDLDYQGKVKILGLQCNPKLRWFRGPLFLDQVEFMVNSSSISIMPAAARWGGMEVQLEGRLSPAGGWLKASTECFLEQVQEQIPAVMPMMHLKGPAAVQHTIHLLPAYPASVEQGPLGWMNAIVGAVVQGHLKEFYNVHFQGEIQALDCEATWKRMPVRLRGITGDFIYDQQKLATSGLISVNAGFGSRDVETMLEVGYAQKPVRLEFITSSGHFVLDPWLRPWYPGAWEWEGKELAVRADDVELSPDSGMAREGLQKLKGNAFEQIDPAKFVMLGDVQLDSLTYRKAQATNFRGILKLDSYPGGSLGLSLNSVAADFYEGRFNAEYTLRNRDLTSRMKMEQVSLGRLKNALNPGEGPSSILSGRLTGQFDYQHDLTQGFSGMAGTGHVQVQDSLWGEGTLFQRIGRILNLSFFKDVVFDSIEGDFALRDSVFSVREPGIVFKGPIMSLVMTGSVDADENLELLLKLKFFSGVAKLPVFKELVEMFNDAAGSVLKFKITGTLQNPEGIAL